MPCIACKVYNCTNPQTDLVQYSLQDAIAFNSGTLSFIVDCPTGYSCPPGSFPITVDFPPGTFIVVLPPPSTGGGGNNQPIVLSLQGCQSLVTITLPAGSSQAAINAAAQSIILQVAAQEAQCNVTPIPPGTPPTTGPQPPIPPSPPGTIPIPFIPPPQPVPSFLNEVVYFVKLCSPGFALAITGVLPSWVTFDAPNSRLVGNAGTFGGTTQALANAAAQSVLDSLGNTLVSLGKLYCHDASVCDVVNSLVWGTPVYDNSGGTGSGSWSGVNFNYSLAVVSGTVSATNTATVPITSGPIIVRLALTINNASVALTLNVGTANLGVLYSIDQNQFLAFNTPQNFDIGVPATTSDQLVIFVTANKTQGVPGTNTLSGVISCFPAFGNTLQTAHAACAGGCLGPGGDGSTPANTFFGLTQVAANATALASAQATADANATDPSNCCCNGPLVDQSWDIEPAGDPGFFIISASGNGTTGAGSVEVALNVSSPVGFHYDFFASWCAPTPPTITMRMDYSLTVVGLDAFNPDSFIEVFVTVNDATPDEAIFFEDFSAQAAGTITGFVIVTAPANAVTANHMQARISIGGRSAGTKCSGTMTIS